jgi:hypothetical protein
MENDILFKNEDVCILTPSSTRGVIIFTNVTARFGGDPKNVCEDGLFSYNELSRKYPEYKLQYRKEINETHNDLIFFRAPYNSDVSTFKSSYGKNVKDMLSNFLPQTIVTIRVDPNETYVYSSEIRAKGRLTDLKRSRILMTEYLEKIKNIPKDYIKNGKDMYSNIITYKKIYKNTLPHRKQRNNWIEIDRSELTYPEIMHFNIEKNTEVVVKLPNIPPSWFVDCINNGIKNKGGRINKRKTIRKKYIKYTRKTYKN